jgi:hypothetical protein
MFLDLMELMRSARSLTATRISASMKSDDGISETAIVCKALVDTTIDSGYWLSEDGPGKLPSDKFPEGHKCDPDMSALPDQR